MNDSEVSEPIEADLPVDVCIDSPSCGCALLAQEFLLLLECLVLCWVACEIKSSVENCPVDFVIRTLKMPVEHHVSSDVPVSNRVTSWQQLSALAQVETEVRERLVASSYVEDLATDHILWSAGSDRATKCLNLADCVRVLVKAFFAERAEEVKSSFFVEVLLEGELVWTGVHFLGSLCQLLSVRLHWGDWAKGWFHARKVEPNAAWAHRLEAQLVVERCQHSLVLFVRVHCCL